MALNPQRARCAAFALLCALCLIAWQALTVRYTYSGNWTGLFCTGAQFPPPPPLASEHLYVFPKAGYDGQAYHDIAHDPFFRRGFARYIDAPRLRYRRILVPGLAFLLAGGRDGAVDAAYIAVVLCFIALGAWWLARLGVLFGYGARLGLCFAAVPAVLISVDRMTVDVAFAALIVGFVLYARQWRAGRLYAVLVAAGLSRETGLLLAAACVLWLAWERRFRAALLFSTAALPATAWMIFVQLRTSPVDAHLLTWRLLSGFVGRLLHPFAAAPSPAIRAFIDTFDVVALAAVGLALVWAALSAWRRTLTPVSIAIYLFALLVMVLAPGDAWSDVYSFGRTLSPLLLLCALDGLAERKFWPSLSVLLVDPAVGLLMGWQLLKVLHGLASEIR